MVGAGEIRLLPDFLTGMLFFVIFNSFELQFLDQCYFQVVPSIWAKSRQGQ